ncbi:MAG: hypothetical protein ACLTEX_00805 [Eggerthella lenta]
MADAAKNPENETEEIVVTEDVEEMDDLMTTTWTTRNLPRTRRTTLLPTA